MKRMALAMVAFLAAMACLLWVFFVGGMGIKETAGDGRLRILATVFPGYDFAREITGELADVRLLLSPGSDSHSYEPTPQDILAIQNADLLLMVGGESETWLKEMLASMGDDAPQTMAMMDCVIALEEELSPSMWERAQAEDHGDEAEELDEHVWTSPKNARQIVLRLLDVLGELDPQNAQEYKESGQGYLSELDALDYALEEVVENGVRTKIIFGDRFPFRYLAHDYGLTYDAAFPGCSEDSEPSARTIMSLIQEIQRDHIPVIFTVEFSSRKIAEILAEETGARILLMNSCHIVSKEEMLSGATYLKMMWENVATLKEALI